VRIRPGHWKAGHWLGRDRADDYEVDGDDHEGSVAKTGRWFSEAWWDGHWLARTRCGTWRARGAGVEACHRGRGHAGEHAYSPATIERARAAAVPDSVLYGSGTESSRKRRRHPAAGSAVDHRAYLEARLDDAERATKGNLLSAEGKRRGVDARRWFKGGQPPSLRYASDELRDWFEAHGRNLTASEFAGEGRRRTHRAAGDRRASLYASAGVPY
jgi:hypothetical protein